MIIFSIKYLKDFSLENVYPSWTVLLLNCYRRIDGTRQRIFFHRSINSNIWLCSYLYCLTYSFQAIKSISIADVNQTKHIDNLCTIFFSRCSICYSLPKANTFIVIILLLLAQIFYFYIIIQLPKLLKEPFSPVFSAFTFPLVISATALKNSLPVLMFPVIWKGLLFIEMLLATVIVLRVFIGYLHFF